MDQGKHPDTPGAHQGGELVHGVVSGLLPDAGDVHAVGVVLIVMAGHGMIAAFAFCWLNTGPEPLARLPGFLFGAGHDAAPA